MQTICVIDNSTLVNLTRLQDLGVFELLRIIFASIHIPAKILQEYEAMLIHEPDRSKVIKQINLEGAGFLVFCNKYDSVALAFLSTTKGIDAGEAEAAAQHQSLYSNFVLSDDQKFIEAIRISDKYVKVLTSLHLIAWLDLARMIDDRESYFKRLHQFHGFTNVQLRAAYEDIITHLGIPFSKKELSKRTSFVKLKFK
jgi:predicted nucleic acid-binding protein